MSSYNQKKLELESLLSEFIKAKEALQQQLSDINKAKAITEKNKEIMRQLAKERQIGFPTLAKAYEEFFKLQDKQLVDFLKFKDKPAIKASEVVSEYAHLRRKTEIEKKKYQYLVDYYEYIVPSLTELREEVDDITEEDKRLHSDYTEEELEDGATKYLTKEEFRKLPSEIRNQMALDRYWKRPNKSNGLLGKMYERYIGYIYENDGYAVDYHGISQGLEDRGRDIIVEKDNEIIIIQCKHWASWKTIYERHIFQFFGSVFQYRYENEGKTVKAVFYSTTKYSDLTKRFGKELGMDLKENFKMDTNYPCIKCNVSMLDSSKIYHLPFDQQYDRVKILKNKGEFYCRTVEEAEKKGFRRAFRYKGYVKTS